MLGKEQAKKMVSIATHKQLTKLLYELEHITAPRDILRKKENLRDLIGKLFTYKEIFELHDDHILELAETVVGLYPEREDLNGYVYYILIYLEKQIARLEEIRKKREKELKIKEKYQDKDPEGFLDLKYETWTYTEGYYYQKAHMYRLLQHSLKDLLRFAERGVICRKRKGKHT